MAAATQSDADREKSVGNEHFKKGDYLKAAACYTKSIKADPANHVIYANRAQAFLKLNKVARALEDADKCIELAPEYVKGHVRKATALAVLGRKTEAEQAMLHACRLEPTNRDIIQLGVQICGKEFVRQAAALRRAPDSATPTAAAAAATPTNGAADAPIPAKPDAASAGAKALVNLSPEEFATEAIRTTIAELLEKKTLQPRVYMQPSPPRFKTRKDKGTQPATPGEEPALGVMQIAQAFESPETLAQLIPALRAHAKDQFKAQAAALAVLKSSIAFPRVWHSKGSRWPFDEACEGIFMQLEHPRGRAMWFTHIEDANELKIGATVSLDPAEFGILPRLFT
ncbi:hypothetical protein KFE25_004327 [Diacronema lutheri]|uniref:Uncharacterized protein n=2 Tax=Diacronema lutheri TaxID=2081491 RepID=A0A8J5XCA7_DIALT|nr:hypothetical protein KFE25_004327 [Diacronema lutheri]